MEKLFSLSIFLLNLPMAMDDDKNGWKEELDEDIFHYILEKSFIFFATETAIFMCIAQISRLTPP